MTTTSYTDFRANLARFLDEAVQDREPVLVTRREGRGNVVVMSEDEFDSWKETVHLLSSPANAARLLRSIADAEAGNMDEFELIEP